MSAVVYLKGAKAEREAKRASRDLQGWQKRRPLSRVVLKHDGSTAEQRRQRMQPTTTPWVEA